MEHTAQASESLAGAQHERATGLPLIRTGERSAKNLVILVLSKEFPLTVQEIHAAMLREHGANLTYQGVRKAVLGLVSDGIVLKDEDEYCLNPRWAASLKKMMEDISVNSKSDGVMPFEEMPPLWKQTVEIDNIADAYYYALRQVIKARDSLKTANPVVACIQPHSLPLTMVKREEYQMTIQLKGAHYIACAANTSLDKANLEVWQKVGAITAMRCRVPKTADIAVTGDFIIEIILPSAARRKVDQLFGKSRGLDPETLTRMQQAWFQTKQRCIVRISRNASRAKKLRRMIIGEVEKMKGGAARGRQPGLKTR